MAAEESPTVDFTPTWNADLAAEIPPPAARMLGRRLIGRDEASGEVRIAYLAPPRFANRHGGVQGGLQSAMLDSATVFSLIVQLPAGWSGVTRSIAVEFLKPALLGELVAACRVVSFQGHKAVVEGELRAPDGTVVSRARTVLRLRSPAGA